MMLAFLHCFWLFGFTVVLFVSHVSALFQEMMPTSAKVPQIYLDLIPNQPLASNALTECSKGTQTTRNSAPTTNEAPSLK
ncbi:hypothetical protein L596_000583 [Steinernema carpocapsae]|uniref:Secreted protein n=1 Tax=Steinernema carpocapsae TaxID=34508 RepID=A0A4U8UIN8_STECR|nr:hypothetical protein L596_000583 [Steinernema carpocapsae]